MKNHFSALSYYLINLLSLTWRHCHYDKQWGPHYHFQIRLCRNPKEALAFFIEILDKELLKYKVENIRWGHTCVMIDEHEKAIIFLSLREKGLF